MIALLIHPFGSSSAQYMVRNLSFNFSSDSPVAQNPGFMQPECCGALHVKTGFLQISAMQNTQWLRVKNENSLTVKLRLNAIGTLLESFVVKEFVMSWTRGENPLFFMPECGFLSYIKLY